jgi:hypothetical protein
MNKKMFPDADPLYVRALRWCWTKPVYIGCPLSVFALLLSVADLFYILFWWIKNWGAKEV